MTGNDEDSRNPPANSARRKYNIEEDDLRREFRHSAECGFAIAHEERIECVVFIAVGVNGLDPNSQGKYSLENVCLNDPKG